jgi:hypothetical protein
MKREAWMRRLGRAIPVSVAAVLCTVALAASPSGSAPNAALARGAAVPRLSSLYFVQLHNNPENRDAAGVLTGIRETNDGKISGKLTLAPPLYGGGPFKGTVGSNTVQFTVASTPGNKCHCISIAFTGSVGPKGSMSGTYVAKSTTGTESGKWRATPHSTFNCQLQSRSNRKYVTAELADPGALKGLLRARSSGVGTWQMFQCVAIGSDQWALKSRVNHKYVTTQIDYPGALKGVLRAGASKVGASERFTFRSVLSCSCYALKAVNSRFATTDPSSSNATRGLLRAHGTTIGSRQEFDITAT